MQALVHQASRSIVGINALYACAILAVFAALYFSPVLLLVVIVLTSVAESIRFVRVRDLSRHAVSVFAKFVCIWPLGMGSVVAFGQLSPTSQASNLSWFSVFINTAVVGNIAMMGFVATGDSLRGITHRIACASLVVWLLLEMQSISWNTVSYQDGFFLFNASPLAWVIAHAIYRAAMMTLPPFDTLRYLILEPASLGLMAALASANGASASLWFGQADTLVASTVCWTSVLLGWFRQQPKYPTMRLPESQPLDIGCAGVHIVVVLIALYHVILGPVSKL
ncbi:hypothetical protein H310_11356 [Aphanomyces invadans]|uniref:Uncharacterized protein n=1 Tax=Aphanomyces invadans TaxID=157072 RepID=A0A024TNY6_9STRA|nr:hypothetical protein H310_11356 [Aphanomyces invadans]ETV95062.1 hypothetical protein H310_11356 [Aphanomyces invadans]|eukprot:XP_008876235.1 hypothetical protein H310_11356 [Aphanomyces invadans]